MSHYVYFISDGEYIKIGVSNNVRKRLDALQTSNARRLELLYVIETISSEYAYHLESILHQMCKAYRAMGEWFFVEWQAIKDEVLKLERDEKSRTIQQKFNHLVIQDLAQYPPISHFAVRVVIKQTIINEQLQEKFDKLVAQDLLTNYPRSTRYLQGTIYDLFRTLSRGIIEESKLSK